MLRFVKNLGLRPKIVLSFSVLIVLMLCLAAVSAYWGDRTTRQYDKAVEQMGEAMFQAQMEIEHLTWVNQLSNSIMSGVPFGGELDPTQCNFGQWYYDYIDSEGFRQSSSDLQANIKRIEHPHIDLHESAEAINRLIRSGDIEEAESVYRNETAMHLRELRDLLERTRDLLDEERMGLIDQAEQAQMQAQWAGIISVSVAVLLGLGLSYALGRYIIDSVHSLKRRAVALANGDFTGREIEPRSRDELGEVTDAFNKMQRDMRSLVIDVVKSSKAVSDSAAKLSSIAGQTREGVQQQHTETDQVATAMNEMTATVAEVSRNTQQSADAATRGSEVVSESGEVIKRSSQAVDQLAEEVRNSADAVSMVEERSNEIGEVLTLIHEITEKTNLLALNAAIEAARAGEQGRGFAVVADEVRTLAGHTKESTEQIEQLIGHLRDGVSQAVQSMGSNEQSARDVVSEVERVVAQLDQMQSVMSEIHDMTAHVASASEEQSQVSEEINRNMQNIAAVSEQSKSATADVESSSEHLVEMAGKLEEKARQFRY